MKQRIITAIISICVLLPVLIFADYPIFPIAIALCSVIAVYELLACVGLKKSVAVSIPFYLGAVAMPFLIRYLGNGTLLYAIIAAALLVSVLYLFTVLLFSHGKYELTKISIAFFSIFYILVGFNALVALHDFSAGGEYVYLFAFLGAWITDTFAYFCGMIFGRGGKHKLLPEVSPKKTVEGSIGGIVFCTIFMVLFGLLIELIEPDFSANLLILAIAGVIVSVVAQIGDLSLSLIKRTYGIKDYGKLFPGHGGMLDRFDSVIAVSTIMLVFSFFFQFFEVAA